MKPPPGWTPQHRRGARRIRAPYVPVRVCTHGLVVCDAHTYRPGVVAAKLSPAKTLSFPVPEWLR